MKIRIPEIIVGRHRLGRNINHDPRSLHYRVEPAMIDKSVSWKRHVPVFDQGNVGSCTGEAEAGLLGTTPFRETLPDLTIDQALALTLYELATQIDPYAGTYPPDDTGSDGLSVSKAAQQSGYISGYVHATSLAEAMTLIQQGPFIAGTNWTTNMDNCPSSGIIKNPAGGSVRGGHEYECWARDAENDLWWFYNSWGADWGKAGTFAYNSAGLQALMAAGGDLTQSVPITSPAPTPTPSDPDLAAWWTLTKPWATAHKFSTNSKAGKAAQACITLAKKKGL